MQVDTNDSQDILNRKDARAKCHTQPQSVILTTASGGIQRLAQGPASTRMTGCVTLYDW